MELISQEHIERKIFTVRGVQVMLDKDLAEFYGVKPIRLREQVKRNPNRFPPDFVFRLNEVEVEFMVSQNAIPSKQKIPTQRRKRFQIIHYRENGKGDWG